MRITIDMITRHKVLKKYTQQSVYGQAISGLASHFFYVDSDIKIEELMDELNENTDLDVLGVVDHNSRPCGIIIRQELMEQLSRPYGRDVLCKYPVGEFVTRVQSFLLSRNIFSVAEEIDELLHAQSIYYFILLTEDNQFAGVFSTRDMHIYLADNTRRDMLWAQEIQTRIVQEQYFITKSAFEAVSLANMAKHVGGDFCYMKQYSEKKWLFALCDVSGKGFAASLVTAILGGMFHIYDFTHGIKRLIKEVNSYLYRSFNMEIYATGVFIDFDEEHYEISVYDMGHSYLFLFKNEKLYRLNTSTDNLPLGVVPEIQPCLQKLKMQNDEFFFVTTDGLLEQKNLAGKTYSLTRVANILKVHAMLDLLQLTNALKADFHAFRGRQTQADDVACILFKYKNVKSEQE